MRFRPCIDLHQGRVKQIVGSTFSDDDPARIATNFASTRPASWFAEMYRRDRLPGGHVIMLGPGNEAAAEDALRAYPGGLHLGGGINEENAPAWLERGAAAVIVTSHVFRDGLIDEERLARLVARVGRARLVLDLSCRKRDGRYWVVTDRWQKFTAVEVNRSSLDRLADSCAEFLIHAADVEGRCEGVEADLVGMLGGWQGIPVTYAGGIRNRRDLEIIRDLGRGRLDFTVGSALDIFGGEGLTYDEVVAFHRAQN
ncbi:MAG: phosphoribosylformimino-5-aminoimidazole carboxamide ribotide isomerase [Candidatus Methylomirabilia bacterium]